ncbi:MAG: efflux RND transporter permease subunit [Acidimicrobiia bacterium]
MRRIINSSLRFRVLVVAAAAGIVFFGVTRVPAAPVDVYPEFTPPYVEVQTEALGLSAAEVEQLITVPLEADLLNGVAWLEDIRSESVPGLSSITLVFEPGTDLFRARQMVQERLAQAHAIPNVSKPPQMIQPVSSTSRTMMIGLSSKTLSLIEVSQLARWTIKPRLMGVEGVANVSTFGHRERQLQVQVDPKQLGAKGVSLQQVVETTGNALWVSPLSFLEASTPGTGGFIETPTQRLGVQHVQPIESADELAQVAIQDTEGLRLGDVAKVVEDHQPLIGDANVDNGAGLLMVIERLPDANTVDVTEGVQAALDDLRPGLDGLKIDTSIYEPAEYIHTATSNVGRAALTGLVLVVLLLAFAFYHWRTALVSVVSILVSLAAAGLVLYLRGTTINSMVLAGLALALGAVVDDAITGTERLSRRLRESGPENSTSTIVEAAVETRSAMTYATLFILLPVVPVFFMGDLFGAFGRPLAVSYILALGASMLTALVLTPALGVLLLGKTPLPARESPLVSRLSGRYSGLLSRLLMSRKPAFALAAVLAVVGLVALPTLRQSELPSLNERDFIVELESKPGTSLTKMNEITAQATKDLRAIPGIRNVASHTGRAITGDKVVDVNSSELWVSIHQDADYGATVAAVRKAMAAYPSHDRDVYSYMQARVKEAKSGADDPVVVRVYGQKPEVLADKAKEVRDELAKIDGIANLSVELPVNEPALEVEVDLKRAQEFGIKPGDVRRQAAALLSGIEVGQLFYDQKVFEVVVWGAPETRRNADDVRNLLLDTARGQIPLREVADVSIANSPDVIEREGAFRRIDVTAKVSGRAEAAVLSDVRKTIEAIDFPLEYRAELIGEYQAEKAAESRLMWLGALAAVGMLLLLQACFGRWLLGALYFLTLPVALVGGVVAALLDGGTVTIGAAVGLLTVLGIAARNGMLLIRRYQQLERREGEPFGVNLVVRGARERLAPTLMSALATALAFAPFVVLGTRPGFEILHPMGVVILGGLVTATLVNVFVVPALYLNFGNVESDTEVDLRLFEEELASSPPATVPVPATPVPANGASVPLAGAGAEA